MAIKTRKMPDSVISSANQHDSYWEERETAYSLPIGEGFIWANPPKQPYPTAGRWKNKHGGRIGIRQIKGVVWVVCLPMSNRTA